MSDAPPIICWFRQDLRLADNPALTHAVESGKPVIALYVHDEFSPDIRPMGAAQKWWLHHGLTDLAANLQTLDCPLNLKSGAAEDVLREIIKESGADAVCWNRCYALGEQNADRAIKAWLKDDGCEAKSFAGIIIHEPDQVRTGSDRPYRVYTPFWKNLAENMQVRAPLPAPGAIKTHSGNLTSDSLDHWGFLPTKPDWSAGMANAWEIGEKAAHKQLDAFLADNLHDYDKARDNPGADCTSRMSPYLRHGHVSPHQLWHACQDEGRMADDHARTVWMKELVWREFSYHLLNHNPRLHERNFNARFDHFSWRRSQADLRAWQKGQTGYPIVDAGMRQLWQTGWMHNRVRMIVGSFLVKHLLVDWREGEDWFWETLVDGDPASNPAQWQWVAGTGADAAPFFRIFNPILQAEKFDPKGTYIKRFVPELIDLPAKHLGAPWNAPEDVLEEAGITLGETYPYPIVDHKKARQRALDTLAEISGKSAGDGS
jgi:deoxyribodipyrimidine photo-lyase